MKLKFVASAAASAIALIAGPSLAQTSGAGCDRTCLHGMVGQVLASMVAHNPDTLPLAPVYTATENSHPAALGMMAAWRTITQAGEPSLLALDPEAGQAYFALDVSEAGDQSILYGRIRVADREITELELFINRARGDHGFSFSPEQLPTNYRKIMLAPPSRRRASHEELVRLARAAFDASDPLHVDVDADCQFTELGWRVVDPGLDDVAGPPLPPGRTKEDPLGCVFPPNRPNDKAARVIAIDDDLGIVVVAAVIRGVVYPYPYYGHMLSAFIPNDMAEPMKAQDAWIERHVRQHKAPIAKPLPATGEVMQVLQFYNGKLQAEQINVHLSGPGMRSEWVQP